MSIIELWIPVTRGKKEDVRKNHGYSGVKLSSKILQHSSQTFLADSHVSNVGFNQPLQLGPQSYWSRLNAWYGESNFVDDRYHHNIGF